jgi:hypothetical protein
MPHPPICSWHLDITEISPTFEAVEQDCGDPAMRRSRAKAKAIDLKAAQQRLALAAVAAFAIVSLLLLIRP